MLIAQISDLHLKAPGTLLFGAVDVHGHMERLVRRLNTLKPRPDAVLITGDITNDGADEDFAAAADLIADIDSPVYPILGNHDLREPARRALAPLCAGVPAGGPVRYAAEAGPVRIIALDSLVEGAARGQAGADQLAWLDHALAAAHETPTLVMIHHPPFVTGIDFMDRIGLADADAFAGVIARHPQVERVLCGHIHRSAQAAFAGTIAMTAPGAAHQVVLDLLPGAPSGWTAEPPGFLLHRWDGERIVTHLAFTEEPGRGRPFSNNHGRQG